MGVPAQQQRSDAVPVTIQYAVTKVSQRRVRQVQSPYVDQQTYGTTGVGTTARRPGGRHASDPAAEASSIMHTEHALLHALYDSTTDTHLSQQGRVLRSTWRAMLQLLQ